MPLVRVGEQAMACRWEVAVDAADPTWARAVAEQATASIRRFDSLWNRFDPASLVARLNRQAGSAIVPVDRDTCRLLVECQRLANLTDRCFDPTCHPLLALWGLRGDPPETPPSQTSVNAALASVGVDQVACDPVESTVRFLKPGLSLDFGAIAKGYAADRVIEDFRDLDLSRGLVHGGTSLVAVVGTPAGQPGWPIAIAAPAGADTLATVWLRDEALAVSAPSSRQVVVGGRPIGHLVDPRTGHPAEAAQLAAVIHPSGTVADALATALLVGGERLQTQLASRVPTAETLLLTAAGAVRGTGRFACAGENHASATRPPGPGPV